jgi:hypothetical protein
MALCFTSQMIIARISRGSALPLFKYILRISSNIKQVENIRVYLWAIVILLENDPVLLSQADQMICTARFLCSCVSTNPINPKRTCILTEKATDRFVFVIIAIVPVSDACRSQVSCEWPWIELRVEYD